MRPHVLVCRLDSAGDVILMGPAISAIAARSRRVTMLCGPRGRAAAELLPGVNEVIVFEAPWIDPEPKPVDAAALARLDHKLGLSGVDQAIIFTSFHQSPLPLALLLRLADIPTIAATCEDYPGSLLDIRHQPPGDVHEVERALALAAAAGFPATRRPVRLAVRPLPPAPEPVPGLGPFVVLHPRASVPSREWPLHRFQELAEALDAAGRPFVVTGSEEDAEATAAVARAGRLGLDLGGRCDLATLGAVLAAADCVVTGNTGPAHLAAAVGTPVVSLFAPVVPAERWRPYGVPHVLLGDQEAPCADSRARLCPVAGHPCLAGVTAAEVMEAVDQLAPARHRLRTVV